VAIQTNKREETGLRRRLRLLAMTPFVFDRYSSQATADGPIRCDDQIIGSDRFF
jgi:hypothetical protein